jgi:predicted DCC family thiol-disulfide oxidoreductase YuxK
MLAAKSIALDGQRTGLSMSKQKPIVFFDGYCGLCNWFVNFALARDKNHRLLFAPLQGQMANTLLMKHEVVTAESVILYDRDSGKSYRESDAILFALIHIGGMFKFASILRIIPRFIRDSAYRFIARHRYQWFGKRDVCRLPTPEERDRFLD